MRHSSRPAHSVARLANELERKWLRRRDRRGFSKSGDPPRCVTPTMLLPSSISQSETTSRFGVVNTNLVSLSLHQSITSEIRALSELSNLGLPGCRLSRATDNVELTVQRRRRPAALTDVEWKTGSPHADSRQLQGRISARHACAHRRAPCILPVSPTGMRCARTC
jgi:hypothetical protein